MLTKIPVKLDEAAVRALIILADREYRDPSQQAAVLIRDELTRRGLLPADPAPVNIPHPAESAQKVTE